MKKYLIFMVAVIVIIGSLLGGCGKAKTTTPATTPPKTTATTPAITTGGTLTVIAASGPVVMSYYPKMVVSDESAVFPAVERLLDANADASGKAVYVGILAESYNIDPVGKTFTFNLRKNVKFFDGSAMTADVVAWNIQLFKDNGRLQQASFLDSIEVKDQNTVVLHFNQYNNEFDFNWGWLPIFSKAAWDAAGTTDDARIAYFTDHIVATGPFTLSEYKRDDHLTWVKNPNYWQPGKPYLDSIVVKYIPDSVAASAMMEKGDADMWLGGSATDQQNLEKKGVLRKAFSGVLVADLVPNTLDPNSRW
jgi:peptide/nickel transport system substrate-binding protein